MLVRFDFKLDDRKIMLCKLVLENILFAIAVCL